MPSEELAPEATIATAGEHALIRHIRARLTPAPDWLIVDVGDDAAVYEPQRNALEVITTDAIVEGVHFDRAFTPPAAIGHRALAVNLSDLAAMGAEPRLATISMALPQTLTLQHFERDRGRPACARRARACPHRRRQHHRDSRGRSSST